MIVLPAPWPTIVIVLLVTVLDVSSISNGPGVDELRA